MAKSAKVSNGLFSFVTTCRYACYEGDLPTFCITRYIMWIRAAMGGSRSSGGQSWGSSQLPTRSLCRPSPLPCGRSMWASVPPPRFRPAMSRGLSEDSLGVLSLAPSARAWAWEWPPPWEVAPIPSWVGPSLGRLNLAWRALAQGSGVRWPAGPASGSPSKLEVKAPRLARPSEPASKAPIWPVGRMPYMVIASNKSLSRKATPRWLPEDLEISQESPPVSELEQEVSAISISMERMRSTQRVLRHQVAYSMSLGSRNPTPSIRLQAK